jgi:hypothetical protein
MARPISLDAMIHRAGSADIVAALIAFGGYGTGEELHDFLTQWVGWSDEKAKTFIEDLHTLERELR